MLLNSLLFHIPSYYVTFPWILLFFLHSKWLNISSGIISLLSEEPSLVILLEQVSWILFIFLHLRLYLTLIPEWLFSLDTEFWLDRWSSVSQCSTFAWVVSGKPRKMMNVHSHPALGLHLTRRSSSKRRLKNRIQNLIISPPNWLGYKKIIHDTKKVTCMKKNQQIAMPRRNRCWDYLTKILKQP